MFLRALSRCMLRLQARNSVQCTRVSSARDAVHCSRAAQAPVSLDILPCLCRFSVCCFVSAAGCGNRTHFANSVATARSIIHLTDSGSCLQQDIMRGKDMVGSLFQGKQDGGTHVAIMSSEDYLSQAQRNFNNLEEGYYISPAFLDKVSPLIVSGGCLRAHATVLRVPAEQDEYADDGAHRQELYGAAQDQGALDSRYLGW